MDTQKNGDEIQKKKKLCFLCPGQFESQEELYFHLEEEHGIFVQQWPGPIPEYVKTWHFKGEKSKTPVKKKLKKTPVIKIKSKGGAWLVTDTSEDDGYSSFEPNANSTIA